MKHLLNTLFVTTEKAYLSLDGENVVVSVDSQEIGRFPLHNLSGIVSFSYSGASPALMGYCADHSISLSFCTPQGKFLARVTGKSNGNVLLRREQYRIADDLERSCKIARNGILGKVYNARWQIERTIRDHGMQIEELKLKQASDNLKELLQQITKVDSLDSLRGVEGAAANEYFGIFDEMILRNKESFYFKGRSKRPPMDNVNAMLSFAYGLLAHDCTSALESVGLDSFVGFMHRDRPGRNSLSLDLMEELRPCMADRFVLSLINNRVIQDNDFEKTEDNAIRLTDSGRKVFLRKWQEKKQETIKHPYLGEKISWGLVPYIQALLLSRYIRDDIDEYPPFLWK